MKFLTVGVLVALSLMVAGSWPVTALAGQAARTNSKIVSLLLSGDLQMQADARVTLPARYVGAWGGAAEAAEFLCVHQDVEGALSFISHEPNRASSPQTGFAFSVDGQYYAYLISQQINLAMGDLVRFRIDAAQPKMDYLDLESLFDHLEKSRLPHSGTLQLTVEFSLLRELLETVPLRFVGPFGRGAPFRKLESGVFDCPRSRFEKTDSHSNVDGPEL
jgi:hypothetical protein